METKNSGMENIKEKRVKLFVPRGSQKDDPNFFIGVNGVNILIPKGQTAEVKPEFKEEYDRAMRAIEMQAAHIDEILEK